MKCSEIIDRNSLTTASTSLGASLLTTVQGFYYLKVFLNLYHLDRFWLNVGQILFMVWNAINDPVFGYMQDVGACGMAWLTNRRKVILYGGPFFAATFMLFWVPWTSTSTIVDSPDQRLIVGLHLITSLFFFDAVLSLVLSAQCGLFTELTTKHAGRVKVVVYMEVANLLGTMVIFPVDALSSSATNFFVFQMCCLVVSVFAMGFFLVTGFFATDEIAQIKENPVNNCTPDSKEQNFAQACRELWTNAKSILRNRDFLCVVGANFCHILRSTAAINFTNIYTEALVSQYGILPIGSWSISFFYTACNVLPKLLVICCWPILEKFGAYLTLLGTILATLFNSVIVFIIGRFNHVSILCFILLENILCSSLWPAVFNIFFPDVIDEDMVLNKRPRPFSTTIFTLNALFTKPAWSLAPVIVVSILDSFGYERFRIERNAHNSTSVSLRDQNGQNSTSMMVDDHSRGQLYDVMFSTMCFFPLVCAVAEILCLIPYRLKFRHKKVDQSMENEIVEMNAHSPKI